MSVDIYTESPTGSTVLQVANVENEFLGISVSEHGPGINMRRCAIEIKKVEDIVTLRDELNKFLESVHGQPYT